MESFENQPKPVIGNLQPTTKEHFRMMMTGLSSTGEAQTDMMKAVMHQKKTQSQ